MCIIWRVDLDKTKQNNKKFFEIVRDAWAKNSDGAGVLWGTQKGVYINKFLNIKDLLKFLFKNINKFKLLAIHFRQATSGRVDLAHTHMWAIDTATGRYVIAVNGIVNNVENWRALLGLEASIPAKEKFDSWIFVDYIKKYNSIYRLGALAELTNNKIYIYNVNTSQEHFLGAGWEDTEWGRVSSQAWLFREYKYNLLWDKNDWDKTGWGLDNDGVWRLYDIRKIKKGGDVE